MRLPKPARHLTSVLLLSLLISMIPLAPSRAETGGDPAPEAESPSPTATADPEPAPESTRLGAEPTRPGAEPTGDFAEPPPGAASEARKADRLAALQEEPSPPFIFCMGVAVGHQSCPYGPGQDTNNYIEPGTRVTNVNYNLVFQSCCQAGWSLRTEIRGPDGVIDTDQTMPVWPGMTFFQGQTGVVWVGDIPEDAAVGRYAFHVWITDVGTNLTTEAEIYFHVGFPPQDVPVGHVYGPCNAPGTLAVNPSACQSDPVNSATGAFASSGTDLRLPGIGLPFEWSRNYTSSDTSPGVLGPGWTHSFATSLSILSNAVLVHGEHGQEVLFSRRSDGTFNPPPGATATLERVSDGYVLTRADGLTLRYDDAGRLRSKADRNGNSLVLSYDSGPDPVAITDTAGRIINLTYNAEGRLADVALPDGRHVGYGYTDGLLTTVTDVRGHSVTYEYDSGGRLATILDQNGHQVVHNEYGAGGRVVSQTDARNNTSTFAWNPDTQTSTMTDARGHDWKDVYSGNVLMKRIDPLGNTTAYHYDGNLNLRLLVDPRGNATSMTYDSRHNMLTRRAPAPLSYQESFTYNAGNDLTSYTDGRGNTTAFGYDSNGNLTSMTQPGNVVTTFGRHPATGLLTSVTDATNRTTTYDYDSAGNLAGMTTPLGHVTSYSYDGSGRLTSVVEARGNEAGANPDNFRSVMDYNAADQLTSITDPLGHVTSHTYDPAGNLASTTTPKSRTTSYGYNAANHLISVTAPDNSVTAYDYDPAGNLVSRTNARQHSTSYAYDQANRLARVTSPVGGVWTYEYDAGGNLIRLVDANGNSTAIAGDGATTYTYDAINRLTGIAYSDATPDVTFAYDANSNRTQMTDGTTQTYAYDALNRLTSTSRRRDTLTYSYDPAGRITSMRYPTGVTADYGYDPSGRLASVTSSSATTTYAYDAADHLVQTTLPAANGHVETRSFDRAGRLTGVENVKGSAVLSRANYTLDAAGNPTEIASAAGVTTLGYDELERLTDVCFQASCSQPTDPFIRYTYDSVGNRTRETRPSGTTTYEYNAGDQLTTLTGPTGTTNFGYDANGNQTQAGTNTFAYDAANRMRSSTFGRTSSTYSYDGDGRRISMTVGRTTTPYFWDPSSPNHRLLVENKRSYVHGHDIISMAAGRNTYYFHYDAIGSVTNVTDAAGTPQWSYAYEPFGGARSETKHGRKAPANVLRFTGEVFDSATGLYHLRARQYDPQLGRFTATDPLQTPVLFPCVSTYAYAENNPAAWVDPTGLSSETLGCRDWGTFTAGQVNVMYGAYKVGTGVPIMAAGAAATATVPILGQIAGPPAFIYGAYQTVTGVARGARGVAQIAGMPLEEGRASDCDVGDHVERFVRGVTPDFAGNAWDILQGAP